MRGIYKEEIILLSKLATEKIAFPRKPDIRTDISDYRVASLLKTLNIEMLCRFSMNSILIGILLLN